MSKYRLFRVAPQDSDATHPRGREPRESKVVEIAGNDLVPFGAIGVPDSTPVSDWAEFVPVDSRAPEAPEEE